MSQVFLGSTHKPITKKMSSGQERNVYGPTQDKNNVIARTVWIRYPSHCSLGGQRDFGVCLLDIGFGVNLIIAEEFIQLAIPNSITSSISTAYGKPSYTVASRTNSKGKNIHLWYPLSRYLDGYKEQGDK